MSAETRGLAGPWLYDYRTGEPIRPATAEEQARSQAAAEEDGGAGVIEVNGRDCYVLD